MERDISRVRSFVTILDSIGRTPLVKLSRVTAVRGDKMVFTLPDKMSGLQLRIC